MRVATHLLRVLLGWALGAAALGAPAPMELPPAGDSWIRVDSAHFTLFSDASASRTKDVALDLERFRAVLLALKPSGIASAPVPTNVFVFKSDGAMSPYKPRVAGKPANAAGFFQPGRDGNYIVLAAGWNTDPRRVVFHEYFHYFMHSNFAPQPLWYDEGAAEFYGSFRSSGNEAQIGLPIGEHIRLLRESPFIPLPELFAIGQDSPEYRDAPRQAVFYAESWALVHYLLRGEAKRAAQFGRFLVLLQQGRNSDEAFRAAFDITKEALERDLRRYVHGDRFLYTRALFSDLHVPEEAPVTPISREEALVRLGDLLAHAGDDRLDDAEAHFRAVLGKNPAHPGALAGLGYAAVRRGRFEAALDFFGKAIEAKSDDFRTDFYYGEMRLRPLEGRAFEPGRLDPETRSAVDDARKAFRRAMARNPGFSEVRASLGRTYLYEEPSAAAEGIPELLAATAALPTRADLFLDLAALYARSGNAARSDEITKNVLGAAADKAIASRREASQLHDAIEAVNHLLEEHREDEAIALRTRLIGGVPAGVREELEAQLAALRRGTVKNRAIRDYNEAVGRWRRKDLAGALALFRSVAASAEDPELARSASERAAEIQRSLSRSGRPSPPRE